jgi:hypothetical protein
MNGKKLHQRVVWSVLIMLFLVGCSAPTATPTPEPSPETVVEVGDVIFDGEECTFTGSPELSPGKYSFILKNLTEEDVNLFVSKHVGGKTFQDVLDLQGEPGESLPEPVYDELFDKVVEPGSAQYKPDGGEVHTYILKSEGEYIVGVWIFETAESDAMKTWFCAPFWVVEATSD